MAQITYNGIELKIVQTRDYLREPIMTEDGTTLLYLKHTIDVACVYNPFATSYNTTPAAVTGKYPPETDSAIRQTLLQHRGILIYKDDDGRTILRSPGLTGVGGAYYTTDAKNGPEPIHCDVVRIHGTKTWMVHFVIVTYVIECPRPTARNPLISHRWKRYVDIDQDYYATVVTEGEAIFRTDELIRLGKYPDQYRQDLFHAIPQNFKREKIQVVPNSDGASVRYQIVDRETPFNGPLNILDGTRIEAFQTGTFFEPNHMANLVNGFMDAAPQVVGAAAGGNVGGAAAAVGNGAMNFVRNMMPSYSMHVMVRVWGNRNSKRKDMMELGIAVCASRLVNENNILGRSEELIVTHELTGKFVEVQGTCKWGPEQLALAVIAPIQNAWNLIGGGGAGAGPLTGLASVLSYFPPNEEIENTITSNAGLASPKPPNGKGTRGTWLGQLVHQTLSAPCAVPDAPQGVNVRTQDLTIY